MMPDPLLRDAEALLRRLRAAGLRLATAESCTGGLLAALLTEIPGSSDVFERGFVTYSNAAKIECLGVSAALIAQHGAVSEPVARAMAEGALSHSNVDVAVGVTGIAGPASDNTAKPVGLVHIAVARTRRTTMHERFEFGAIGRSAIRQASARNAFRMVGEMSASGGQHEHPVPA